MAVVDLSAGTVLNQIAVGLAPYDVVLGPDGAVAWVSNWGGRRPGAGDRTATSSGSAVVVDARGVVVSEFYNQTAVWHTIERILGLAPDRRNVNDD